MIDNVDLAVRNFYKKNGPCCAGCDYWRYHNSVIGECIKSQLMSAKDRISMLEVDYCSIDIEAGHALTRRDYHCGKFYDSEAP